jgi:hypothetical protein
MGALEAEVAEDYAALVKLIDNKTKINLVAGKGFEPLTFGLCTP